MAIGFLRVGWWVGWWWSVALAGGGTGCPWKRAGLGVRRIAAIVERGAALMKRTLEGGANLTGH